MATALAMLLASGALLAPSVLAGGGTTTAMPKLHFGATLTGAAEVPGPGAADGVGWASITITGNLVCADLAAQRLGGPATAAHVHRGARGVAGPIVVNLPTPAANGRAADCIMAEAAIVQEIIANPANFYVNVHTAALPAGAVRGQLDGRSWQATLLGASERPGPGHPTGGGQSFIVIDAQTRMVCVGLTVNGIGQASAAHIHRGGPDVAGPIVVDLGAPNAQGWSDSCSVMEQALATEILGNPTGFYVNVHTAEFPAGAVRGQLARIPQ